jgi:hypothetical protein
MPILGRWVRTTSLQDTVTGGKGLRDPFHAFSYVRAGEFSAVRI